MRFWSTTVRAQASASTISPCAEALAVVRSQMLPKRLNESVGELHLCFDDLNPGQPRPVVGVSELWLRGTELLVGALGQDPDSVQYVQLEDPKERRPSYRPASAGDGCAVESDRLRRSINSMMHELNRSVPASHPSPLPHNSRPAAAEHRHLSPGSSGKGKAGASLSAASPYAPAVCILRCVARR